MVVMADLAVNRPVTFSFFPAVLVVGTSLGCSAMVLGCSGKMSWVSEDVGGCQASDVNGDALGSEETLRRRFGSPVGNQVVVDDGDARE